MAVQVKMDNWQAKCEVYGTAPVNFADLKKICQKWFPLLWKSCFACYLSSKLALFLFSTSPLPLFMSCPAAPGIWYSGMLPTLIYLCLDHLFFSKRRCIHHRIPKMHIRGRLVQIEVIIFNKSPYVGWKDSSKAHSVATRGNLISSSIP